MSVDKFGRVYYKPHEVCDMLYKNPNLNLANVTLDDDGRFNQSLRSLHYEGCAKVLPYSKLHVELDEFDKANQSNWHMPDSYKEMDIAQWVLNQCKTNEELQRCGEELLLFQEKGMFPVLQFMKYLVDTLRENNVVWGVGRGSSVASYVLYLIGIHRINALYFDLDIKEFLR